MDCLFERAVAKMSSQRRAKDSYFLPKIQWKKMVLEIVKETQLKN